MRGGRTAGAAESNAARTPLEADARIPARGVARCDSTRGDSDSQGVRDHRGGRQRRPDGRSRGWRQDREDDGRLRARIREREVVEPGENIRLRVPHEREGLGAPLQPVHEREDARRREVESWRRHQRPVHRQREPHRHRGDRAGDVQREGPRREGLEVEREEEQDRGHDGGPHRGQGRGRIRSGATPDGVVRGPRGMFCPSIPRRSVRPLLQA